MLPLEHRLRAPADFRTLKKHGKRWRGQHMALSVLENTCNVSRFGFVVSRRVGNAVTRNLVKRRLRAIVQAYMPQISPGIDVVIVANSSASHVTFNELKHDMVTLLKRSGHLVK